MVDEPPPKPNPVQQCWDRCLRDEERIFATDHRELREEFEDSLTFGPLLSSSANDTSSDQLVANNYRQLVRMLRDADSPDTKLRFLAMWLRQEHILQPREFLPERIRKELVKATMVTFKRKEARRNRLTVKPSELKYALVAEAWKPYFGLMQLKYELLPKGVRHLSDRMTELGFKAGAVAAALGASGSLTPPIEAACRFAADRLNVGEDTVVVAHSKVYLTPRPLSP